MAKIAGRKNDGAWFRFNKWLLERDATIAANFAVQLEQTDTIQPAFSAVQEYITYVGATASLFPATMNSWSQELSIGIPRQIWDGVTTYDYYVKGPDGSGGSKYTKQMQSEIFQFSKDVRLIAKQIRFSTFELKHLAGLTHPPASATRERVTREYLRTVKLPLIAAEAERLRALLPPRAEKPLTNSADESISTVLRARTSRSKGRGSSRKPEPV